MKLLYIVSIVALSASINCMDQYQSGHLMAQIESQLEQEMLDASVLREIQDLIKQCNLNDFKERVGSLDANILKHIAYRLIECTQALFDRSYFDCILGRFDDLELSINDWVTLLYFNNFPKYPREAILAIHPDSGLIIEGLAKREASRIVSNMYVDFSTNEINLVRQEIESEFYRKEIDGADVKGKIIAFLRKNQTTLISSALALTVGFAIARKYKSKDHDQK